ncbi:MAG: glycosyltransferase family 39 protein [Chloroflexi bacterium]|nr:glycosyltransferase family 39 protein [Chloroflexota bacterium]
MRRLLRSQALWGIAIFLLALALRLAYVTLFVGWDYVPQRDAAEYSAIAANLAAGHGYRLPSGELTAIRPPLFPLLLAGVYAIFGVHYGAALVVQGLLGALTCVIVYRVGAEAFGEWPGRLAGGMAAGYPLLIYNDGQLLSETIFLVWVTLALWAMLRLARRLRTREVVVLGIALGLVALTRPNGLILWAGVVIWALWYWRRRGWPVVGAVTLIVLLLLTPWVVRNWIAMDAFIPASTMGGAVLLGSYNEIVLEDPAYRGDWVSPCRVPGARCGEAMSEVARDRLWRAMGLAFIRSHVKDLPEMAFWRFVNFWHLYRFTRGFPENLGFYAYVAMAALAVVGAGLYRSRWKLLSPLYVVVICFTANALVFWGGFRMRAPVEPVLLVLAAGALWRIGVGIKQQAITR